MAGHYSIPQHLNSGVINLLNSFLENNPVAGLIPFNRYPVEGYVFQRLTDRNDNGDTDVISVQPVSLYDADGLIETYCTAEIHLCNDFINQIYCVL